MKPRELPALERLRELFEIDATSPTGLRRLIAVGRCPAGSQAGCDSRAGYWKISVDGQQIHVHRIIYVLRYNSIPGEHLVSHVNSDGYDNRIANLRVTAYSQGTRTRRKRDESLALPKGVSKIGRYYRAQLYTPTGVAAKCGSLAAVTLWTKQQLA
jgi:hypothetical protein